MTIYTDDLRAFWISLAANAVMVLVVYLLIRGRIVKGGSV